ncbi:intron Large complex component GCFC2 [Dromiciops gliroides]|uniref:intron Large complex component GCFC2 n=1 Tax=Dromiciops gliroides TaxID=33562 RepID=UPI001CC62505|nr:intron Large complex component GCFC2 [Dromiciops gliroides]
MPHYMRRTRRLLWKASYSDCGTPEPAEHGFTQAQKVWTMSQRPPRNFRQRQADSDSSSDSDSDPGPGPDSGLVGRASERALGAPRNRGRARVWATSRRAGPVPRGVPGAGGGASSSDSCPSSPETNGGSSVAPGRGDEDPEANTMDFSGSGRDLGSSGAETVAQGDAPGSLDDPARALVVRGGWRRGAKAQEDYLPLSTRPQGRSFGVTGSSDIDSEDGLASGGVGISTLSLRRTGEAASNSDMDYSGSEEEAQDAWEAQQMKKALRVPDLGLSHNQTRPMATRTLEETGSFPAVNLEIIKKQLSSRLASLEGVHRSHQREYERCLQDMHSAKNAIEDLEKAPDPAPSHAFYRGLKAYLATLVDCLSEKIVPIQELESAMHSLLEERAAFFLRRRQGELQNEAVYLQQLAARKMDDSPASDSFAEDAGTQRLLEETVAWRIQRRQARESSGTSQQPEGMSSDDDDDDGVSEGADFWEKQGAILQSGHSVFEDVSEEFSDVQKILLRFQQWREWFPDSYYEAYASLCLPKLFSPFIRIQMLDWNPLTLDCISVQRMPWFQYLAGFAAARREEDNPDREILPAALDKTVLPHLTGFVRSIWDPLSTSQTRSLVEHCREILSFLTPTRGRRGHTTQVFTYKHQELMDSVISRLKRAVEEDVFIPLYPKKVVEDKTLPHSSFQERQFWSAVKLWGNLLLWNDLVLEDDLRELALDKLMNRYLVIGLSNACPGPGVVEKYRWVVESLPESWLSRHPAGCSIPQLTSLTHTLVRAAQQLHDNKFRSEVQEMVLLLVKMKALTQARTFVEKNQLDLLRSCVNDPQ